MTDMDTTYSASDEYSLEESEEGSVLVPNARGEGSPRSQFKFNDVATFIWRRLADGKSVTEVVAAMVEEYEVTEDQAAKDVPEFVEALLEKKLITPA